MTDMVTNGVLSHIRFMKTTGEMKLEITIPREMASAAFERIGGFPNPAESRHVAVAVLNAEQDHAEV